MNSSVTSCVSSPLSTVPCVTMRTRHARTVSVYPNELCTVLTQQQAAKSVTENTIVQKSRTSPPTLSAASAEILGTWREIVQTASVAPTGAMVVLQLVPKPIQTQIMHDLWAVLVAALARSKLPLAAMVVMMARSRGTELQLAPLPVVLLHGPIRALNRMAVDLLLGRAKVVETTAATVVTSRRVAMAATVKVDMASKHQAAALQLHGVSRTLDTAMVHTATMARAVLQLLGRSHKAATTLRPHHHHVIIPICFLITKS